MKASKYYGAFVILQSRHIFLKEIFKLLFDEHGLNHLGSPVTHHLPDIKTASDYYPFGWAMPGRKLNMGGYRYGFNDQEMDNEVKSAGISYAFEYRMYDARAGRFLSVDPAATKYPSFTPYSFVDNMPLIFTDPQGDTLRAVDKVSGERALGIFRNSMNDNSKARELFQLKDDGITFKSIKRKDFESAKQNLSSDEQTLLTAYASLINGTETNVIEVVKRGENLSNYGKELSGFPTNAINLDKYDGGGKFGQAYYDDNLVKLGNDGHYVAIVADSKGEVSGYSDKVIRPSKAGELMAHEWGHALGVRGGSNHLDMAIQMGNTYLRSAGAKYHRMWHSGDDHSKGFNPQRKVKMFGF